ncbi:AAA family ATPase [Acinetobacter populi]|uniref:AAA family ATPase n=1 Tax=Acinetobacter populi TaxID=1582270 RepID=A0A1Z9Z2F2_9GAMM|nr:AAA family ATPase [Acinetobacter populi]OUY08641.1 AAA family ATPase [Acinetobacter populi]
MTFASDRLQHQQDVLAQQQYDQQGQQQAARTSRFKFEPQQLMQMLRTRIVGQPHILDALEDMLNVVKADFNHPERPLSVTMLLGPTGVGKTETVRLISEAIHGHAHAFCRIDMNTLAQEHYAAALTGAPPGYVGSKEGNTLFDIEAIQGSFSKPGIVLFDEIEKASTEVIRALLNVLETGTLTLTAGTKSIDFRNCMIFMTSNVGAKESQARLQLLNKFPARIADIAHRLKLDDHEMTKRALKHKFDPEFLNRIDRILYYQAIQSDEVQQLIAIELEKLNRRLKRQGRAVTLSDSAAQWLAKDHDISYGARGLVRKLRTHLEPILARYFLTHPEVGQVHISLKQQQLVVERGAADQNILDQQPKHSSN